MKTCITCKRTQPFTEFPIRIEAPDGYRNSCYACNRVVWNRYKDKKKNDPVWVEKELARQRGQHRKKRAQGFRDPRTKDQWREVSKKQRLKFPEKESARQAVK